MNTINTNNAIFTTSSAKIAQMKNITSKNNSFLNALNDTVKQTSAPDGESFEDMYFHTTGDGGWDPEAKHDPTEGCIQLLLGQNDLPKFMDYMQGELEYGKSLTEIVKSFNTAKQNELGKNEATLTSDRFWINPDTGAVQQFGSKPRNINTEISYDSDISTAKKIADDLATFIRYSAFATEHDDEAKVERLFDYIKDKQKTYSVTRFDDIYYAGKELDPFIAQLWAEKEDEENREGSGDPEAIDDFIETLRVHQQQMNAMHGTHLPVDGSNTSSAAMNNDIGKEISKAERDRILAVYYLP